MKKIHNSDFFISISTAETLNFMQNLFILDIRNLSILSLDEQQIPLFSAYNTLIGLSTSLDIEQRLD